MVPWEDLDIFGSRFLIQVVGFACSHVGVIILEVLVASSPGICLRGVVVCLEHIYDQAAQSTVM